MHVNEKLSLCRYAVKKMDGKQHSEFVRSLSAKSELRQSLEALQQIPHVGDSLSLELLIALLAAIVRNENENSNHRTEPRPE